MDSWNLDRAVKYLRRSQMECLQSRGLGFPPQGNRRYLHNNQFGDIRFAQHDFDIWLSGLTRESSVYGFYYVRLVLSYVTHSLILAQIQVLMGNHTGPHVNNPYNRSQKENCHLPCHDIYTCFRTFATIPMCSILIHRTLQYDRSNKCEKQC
jgi:hypothetical protein